MYPVLKIMHMLNFLDTFSMGITKAIIKSSWHNKSRTLLALSFSSFRQHEVHRLTGDRTSRVVTTFSLHQNNLSMHVGTSVWLAPSSSSNSLTAGSTLHPTPPTPTLTSSTSNPNAPSNSDAVAASSAWVSSLWDSSRSSSPISLPLCLYWRRISKQINPFWKRI